jgi:hypothetical protein
MKRLMIGLAAVMMTSAGWNQAPAQEVHGSEGGGKLECTAAVASFRTNQVQLLTARLNSVAACQAWALDAAHLNPTASGYKILVHDGDGKVLLQQSCSPKSMVLFDSSHAVYACKDAAA